MEADLGEELLALDADAGSCFGFNEVATWIWRRLAEPATFDQLRDGLLAEYDVSDEQCTSELQALLDDLLERGLIAIVFSRDGALC
jgi:hypothetical protein